MSDQLQTKRSRFFYFKAGLLAAAAAGAFIIPAIKPAGNIRATGEGSPAECSSPTATVDGSQDNLTYNAPSGQTVTGVCIKSGTGMFGGTSHSGLLGNGTFENCYTVSGVGTGTITVQRTGTVSETCQGLSHIDVFASESSPTPTPTASPTESPTAAPAGTPEATPNATPTASPAPATEGGGGGGGGGAAAAGAVAGASAEAPASITPTPTPAGAVLGAEAELPATGPETYRLISGLLTLVTGTGLTAWGLKKQN